MEIIFKKQLESLQHEVVLKSVDLDDDIEDFQVDIEDYSLTENIFSISPRCIRCDLCVEECPVGAITSSTSIKRSRIKNNCVKCEICTQTCPVSCIYLMEASADIDTENDEVKFSLKERKSPHRILKMDEIAVDHSLCVGCGSCTQFCPTKAINLKDFSTVETPIGENYSKLKYNNFADVKKDLCIGCGSCSNLCPQTAINLKNFLGPVIITKRLLIDQDTCVECQLCEENCPVEAIKLENGSIILDNKKCIKCNVCSTKCPVNALNLEKM
ncbi:4Fe-4S binding protein [Methanobrevibacter curvatus]|uniref:Ferredoxin n=1 Tax=Methanobrevibacter curvatus TaxID=49547 RepID=A0A166AXM7_9EURY|nr:4Fe-4S binding protein [Methanobrevibacter curvatus]KZX12603.1 ferredoxin [Methanobrevibacter curvatus]